MGTFDFMMNGRKRLPLMEMGPFCEMPDPYDPRANRLYPNPFNNGIKQIGSFREYLMGHFYGHYVQFIIDLVESGKLSLGKKSPLVPVLDFLTVKQAEVERIDLYRKSLDEVFVDIIMSVTALVGAGRGGSAVSDTLTQWYRVRTSTCLAPERISFNDLLYIMVYDRSEPPPGAALDEYLVPYITAETLDWEGETLLSRYYPETLDKPVRVNGEELARRMGLKVSYYNLAPDHEICGQIYFEAKGTNVYGSKGNILHTVIPAGTIVVDFAACVDENGRLNKEKLSDAIIHECYHAFRHRLFYLGQRLYNEEIQCLSCTRAAAPRESTADLSGEIPEGGTICKTPLDWVEWQADRAVPRIRMPERTARMKVDELFSAYQSRFPNMTMQKVTANVVKDLAKFYGVSRESARLRMLELGYPQAQGVLNYVNGGYVADYAFAPGTLGRDQTFTIGLDAAMELYAGDTDFRDRIASGCYQYVDGHFCLSDRRYLRRRNGALHMTSYALAHMDKCCIVFDVWRTGLEHRYREGTLQKEDRRTTAISGYAADQPVEFDYLAESKRLSEIIYSLPMSPAGTLKGHMERLGVTVEKLVAKSGVSESTIKRLRRDNDYHPSKANALAICIGLQLEPPLRRDWLNKAGVILTASPSDMLYELLLDSMYRQPISLINQKLEKYGLPVLCRGGDELDG